MQEVKEVIEHAKYDQKVYDISEKLISQGNKEEKFTQQEKNHSFLDDGPILISKLPKQIFDLLKDATPNIVSVMGVAYYVFMNMFFAQRTGDDALVAAFGMGVTWLSSTTLCIQSSISNGLFIQLAHAYGSKQYKLMQALFQRCQGILFGIGILSLIILVNTKSILMWFGIEEQISNLTEVYAVSCIPSIFGTILYDSSKQLLMAQNIFDVPMKIGMIICFIHPAWLYLLTEVFNFGLIGIGIARGISEWTGYIALCLYIKQKKLIQQTWNFKYDLQIMFSEWIPFLKITIPIGAIVMLEWLFFQISTLLVARLNDNAILAGQTSFISLILFFFMTPLGLSWTTNSYLGNAVGQGKKKLCQQFSKIIMISCGVIAVIYIIIGELLKGFFYDVFTVNDEMGQYFLFAYNFYIYGFLICDFYQITLSGILKCCDKQNYTATCYFVVYYIFGLPITIYLTFTLELKQAGVWITQALVATVVSIIFYIQIIKVDWDQAINAVKSRNQKEHEIIDQELHILN